MREALEQAGFDPSPSSLRKMIIPREKVCVALRSLCCAALCAVLRCALCGRCVALLRCCWVWYVAVEGEHCASSLKSRPYPFTLL